jgi:dihydrofolate synthase/folylpolyglutamate synthase
MPKPTSAARPVGRLPVETPPVVEAPKIEVPSPGDDGFSSFAAALKYLNDRVNYERGLPPRGGTEFRLDRMRALLEKLGNPQRDVKCVHVAGSKGKGSVVEMASSCLTACGYTTGIYTSPHLVDVRERLRIDGEMIGHAAFNRTLGRAARAAEALKGRHGDATYFELLTAQALTWFAEEAVDVAVIEVGIGGRLDATNLVEPEVTAVTAIQLEHTQVLGDTLEQIAREKAGIFKPGICALTVPQSAEVMAAFRECAARAGASLEVVGEDIEFSYRFEATPELGPHARVCLTTPRSEHEHLPVPLKGEHQAYNCGLALAILDKLRDRGFDTPELKVAEGLSRTPTQGRMELVWESPRILVDGAHTPESIHCLVRAIGAHVKYDSMVAVFGCSSDKDVKGMLGRLATGADKVIFTKSASNPRGLDPRELQKRFAEVSPKMTQSARTVADALNLAARAVGRDDLICATGSFYIAGEAKKHLLDLRARRASGKG